MSRFLTKSQKGIISTNNNDYCKDNIRFFTTLAVKLRDMAISINKRFNDLKNKTCQTVPGAVVFAAVDVPKMTIGVKYEYIEYITRYGPPNNGIFDPVKLDIIRSELGISNSSYTL